ncbi:hypothetical protein HY214_01755 [Candidatus Roizmanbacteria bacterium]|nr:hypothetical protein [Candidatus Roizmanbacteria bacterium]
MDQKNENVCPLCSSPLKEVEETPSGKKLQRCSTGSWNRQTRQTEGCPYVRWLDSEPQVLDEKCPKCASPLVMTTTRSGKKLKKCSKGGWDRVARKATGCDYIEWFNGSKVELDEDCPTCGAKLLLVTTATGKKMKKCSTAGWDRAAKQATGCSFIQWLNSNQPSANGDEDFPAFES